jgi:hypothetical protein
MRFLAEHSVGDAADTAHESEPADVGNEPRRLRPGGVQRLLLIVAVVLVGLLVARSLMSHDTGSAAATPTTHQRVPPSAPTGLRLKVSTDNCADVTLRGERLGPGAPVCASGFQTSDRVYEVIADPRLNYSVLLIPSGKLLPSSDYSIIDLHEPFALVSPTTLDPKFRIALDGGTVSCKRVPPLRFECTPAQT